MDSSHSVVQSSELHREWKRAGIAFLKTELETALVFAEIALQSASDSQKRSRNRANARKGYDTFLHLRQYWSAAEPLASCIPEMEQKLRRLQSALRALGETL